MNTEFGASRPPLSSVVNVSSPCRYWLVGTAPSSPTRCVFMGSARLSNVAACPSTASRSPAEHRHSAFQAVLGAVLVPEADAQTAQPTLALELQIVARARQVIRVVVQMLVDRAPQSRVPVALEAEISIVRKLQHRAVRVRLQIQSERHVKTPGAEIEPAHILAARSSPSTGFRML